MDGKRRRMESSAEQEKDLWSLQSATMKNMAKRVHFLNEQCESEKKLRKEADRKIENLQKKVRRLKRQLHAADEELERADEEEDRLHFQLQEAHEKVYDLTEESEENAVLRGDLKRSKQELKNIFKKTVVPMEQKVLHTTEELANVVRQLEIAQDQNRTLHHKVIAMDRYRLNIENSLKCANCANVGDYIRAVCRSCGQFTLCKTCIESMPEKFCTKCLNSWKDTDAFFFAKNPIMFP